VTLITISAAIKIDIRHTVLSGISSTRIMEHEENVRDLYERDLGTSFPAIILASKVLQRGMADDRANMKSGEGYEIPSSMVC
jgi:hypothetical protein